MGRVGVGVRVRVLGRVGVRVGFRVRVVCGVPVCAQALYGRLRG